MLFKLSNKIKFIYHLGYRVKSFPIKLNTIIKNKRYIKISDYKCDKDISFTPYDVDTNSNYRLSTYKYWKNNKDELKNSKKSITKMHDYKLLYFFNQNMGGL